MTLRPTIFLVLVTCYFFCPLELEATFSSIYYPADSTVQSLILKRNGEIKKSISIGQEVSVKTMNALPLTGKLNEINSEFLVVGERQIPIATIDWIKVKSKSKNSSDSFIKGVGISLGIGLLAILSYFILFATSYGGGGASVFFGLIIIGGLVSLFVSLLSGKKYRLKKYDLEIR